MTRSTGDRLLDQAALSAVKRARFARPPAGYRTGFTGFPCPLPLRPEQDFGDGRT
ncbi:energy transducer TonB [Sulfitobacter porphyrae]|uniref:Energy transducer TonB n=1 Tax=Sulfitobacter porphyrae TaxID=1246864 RepID=A0ABW2B5B9_9RHOB